MLLMAVFALLWGASVGNWRQRWLWACLLLGAILVGLTEGLSLFGLLSPVGVSVGWGALLVALIGGFASQKTVRKRFQDGLMLVTPQHTNATDARAVPRAERWALIGALGLLFSGTALAALASPINNWDSMTYHLPRVYQWLTHASLDHYPTHIIRQLYQNPFAEYAALHWIVLSGAANSPNLIQAFAWISAMVAVAEISARLGANPRAMGFAALWVATVPLAILEASGTQNDLVVALWWVLMGWALFLPATLSSAAAFGVALGLTVLTKGTGYLLAFPLCLIYGGRALWMLWRVPQRQGSTLQQVALVVGLFVLVNGGHWWRNWSAFGSPIYTEERYSNAIFTPAALASNSLRNLHLNAVTPFDPVNTFILRAVRWTHIHVLQLALDDPRTTYLGFDYEVLKITPNEDVAPSPLHFFIVWITVGVALVGDVLKRHPHGEAWFNPRRWAIPLLILLTFALFCGLLKWQVWNNRLLLPLFIGVGVWMALRLERLRGLLLIVAVVLWLQAVPYLAFHCNRALVSGQGLPFSCNRAPIWAGEAQVMFNSRAGAREPYQAVTAAIQASGCRSVGVLFNGDSWEYPLWGSIEQVNVTHVAVQNPSGGLPAPPHEALCALVESPSAGEAVLTVGETPFTLAGLYGLPPDTAALYWPAYTD